MTLSGFLASPFSRLVLRPAFDRLAVPALARLYFPVSRLWARGLVDPGDGSVLLAEAPGLASRRSRLVAAIARAQDRGRAHDAARARWEAALFGGSVPDGALAQFEDDRAAAAQALMLARTAFLPLLRRARIAPVGWDILAPAAVEARHGARLADAARAFGLPDPTPAVEVSRAIPGDGFETLWLRAETAVAGRPDTLWARIERPASSGRRPGGPALVFAHGIAMENEFWRETSSLVMDLARAGVTMIQPEGPWHGRRRIAGTFGGEPTLARGPMGLLDYIDAHARELALIVAWARDLGHGPVAVGGVSLGALTAQMALSASRRWPARYRPDAGFLVSTTGSLMEATMAGSLAGALGLSDRLARTGWDEAELARWMPLLEPDPAPPLDPGRVVAVLGSADEITPYAGGRALMTAWGVPAENVFVRPLGHFSAALSLFRDRAPLARLAAVLAGARE